MLHVAVVDALGALGVEPSDYRGRDYSKTQDIADAALFLGFDGLVVPSARWPCLNVILFTERLPLDAIELQESEQTTIDWSAWRGASRQR